MTNTANNTAINTVRCKVLAPFRLKTNKYNAGDEIDATAEQCQRLAHLMAPIDGQVQQPTVPKVEVQEAKSETVTKSFEAPPKDKQIKKQNIKTKSITRGKRK